MTQMTRIIADEKKRILIHANLTRIITRILDTPKIQL